MNAAKERSVNAALAYTSQAALSAVEYLHPLVLNCLFHSSFSVEKAAMSW